MLLKFQKKEKIRMCSCRKYSYSPHRRDWNFLGGGVGGSVRPKKLKKCMKLNWNFLSAGEVWIFLELELEKGSLHVHFLI